MSKSWYMNPPSKTPQAQTLRYLGAIFYGVSRVDSSVIAMRLDRAFLYKIYGNGRYDLYQRTDAGDYQKIASQQSPPHVAGYEGMEKVRRKAQ